MEKIAQLMWVRAALFALLGVGAALLAVKLAPFVPDDLPAILGSDAVHQILNILASSMLAVTTFSLSVMVASYSAAANNVSPRATRLLREDPTTQNVLAVFLGSFLFSLVGIVALSTGYYSDRGRFVLFVVSIGVIGVIVFTMLRWIDHLTRLGRVGETTARVEKATREAIGVRLDAPYLGGTRLDGTFSDDLNSGFPVFPERIGYVAYVDMANVQQAAEELDAEVCMRALPGTYVHKAKPLAVIVSRSSDRTDAQRQSIERSDHGQKAVAKIRNAFEVADERSYSQDPRFGLAVLAEVASRALSSGINDAGTAIDVLGRGVRLLAPWVEYDSTQSEEEVKCNRVVVPKLETGELFDDLFAPIARDAAGNAEVHIRLQKSLLALAEMGNKASQSAALRHSRQALERSEESLALESEKQAVREVAAAIERISDSQQQS